MTDFSIWLHLVGCAFYAMAAVAGVRGIFSPAKNIEPMGRVAKMIIFCGWVAQTAYIIGLGVREERHPWNSPHEVLLFFVWASVLVYLVVDFFFRVAAFAAFFAPAIALFSVAATFLTEKGEGAASGVFVKVHGMAALIGSGAFVLGALAALMYLIQDRQLKHKQAGSLFNSLPSLSTLDRLNLIAVAAGFLLFAVALLSGFMLISTDKTPESALVWFSSLAWAAFGVVLYCRLSGKLHGRKIAYLTLAGLLLLAVALAVLLLAEDTLHAMG